MAAFSSSRSGIWFRGPNPLNRGSKAKSNILFIRLLNAEGHKVKGSQYTVFICSLVSMGAGASYRGRNIRAKAMYRKAITANSRPTFWKVLCRVWLCLVRRTHMGSCLYFCHPRLNRDSCCLKMMTSGLPQTLAPRILIPPLGDPCAGVSACWKGQIWWVTGPVWLGGKPALVWKRSKSHHPSS